MNTAHTPYFRVSAKIEKLVSAITTPMKSALEKMGKKLQSLEASHRKTRDAFKYTRHSTTEKLRNMAEDLKNHFDTVQSETLELKSTLSSNCKDIKQAIESNQTASNHMQRAINENLTKLSEIVGDLKNFSVKKGEDLRRWQEGYDWKILKDFVTGILFVLFEMDREIQKAGDSGEAEKLIYFRDFLCEELASAGVSRFGDEFVGEKKPTSSSEASFLHVETDKRESDGIVTRVLDYGYKYDDGNGRNQPKVIKPARLEFLRYNEASNNENK